MSEDLAHGAPHEILPEKPTLVMKHRLFTRYMMNFSVLYFPIIATFYFTNHPTIIEIIFILSEMQIIIAAYSIYNVEKIRASMKKFRQEHEVDMSWYKPEEHK